MKFSPLPWKHLSTYRSNLAMAHEQWPHTLELGSSDRIFVLAPHPDDETLGAGGLVARARRAGLAVRLAFLTNGDGSRTMHLSENVRKGGRYLKSNDAFIRLARVRQQEALAAAEKLGVQTEDVVFLGYPDGGTHIMWEKHWHAERPYRSRHTKCERSPYANSHTPNAIYCGEHALGDVEKALQSFLPTIVLTTHHFDTHADHVTAYNLCASALENLRKNDADGWSRTCRFLTFLIHYGPWPAPSGYRPHLSLVPPASLNGVGAHWMTMQLSDAERDAKRAALEHYKSQLATTPRYLRSFVRRNELFSEVSL